MGIMDNTNDDSGVHVGHCCSKHGCKYGDDDCAVVVGTHEQAYACESCEPVWFLKEEIERLQKEIEHSTKLEERLGRPIYHDPWS